MGIMRWSASFGSDAAERRREPRDSAKDFLFWNEYLDIGKDGRKNHIFQPAFEHFKMRVRSWLRMNAGGVLNTCKSNEELLLKFSDG